MHKNDKILKEDEDFIWKETVFGIGYVVSKKAYFSLYEVEIEITNLYPEMAKE